MVKSPEQFNMEGREGQKQEVDFGEQNLLDPDLMKNIHEAAEKTKKEEEKNPGKIAELREELDKTFGAVGSKKVEGLSLESESQQKQEKWNETLKSLEDTDDRLGRPIDKGIKEAVIAFKVNGFPTQSSCEGHVEKRSGKRVKISPYIDIGVEEPKNRFIGEEQFREEIASKHGVDAQALERNEGARNDLWEYISANNPQETPEYIVAREANQKKEQEVRSLLDDFYGETPSENRKVRIPKTLTDDGSFRVTTTPEKSNKDEIGLFQIRSAKKELKHEQSDFSDFAKFMKDRYFGEEQ